MTLAFHELARPVGQLIWTWWANDRIRCSPTEGRLLQLSPRSIIVIEGEWAVVRRRTVQPSCAEPVVSYECETNRGPAQLTIDARGEVERWETSAGKSTVDASEIEVFPVANESRLRERLGGDV